MSQAQIKDVAFQLKGEYDKVVFIAGGIYNEKPHLTILLSDALVADYGLNAGELVRAAAQEIKGGGGGQAFFATAGGSDADGIDLAIEKAHKMILHKINAD